MKRRNFKLTDEREKERKKQDKIQNEMQIGKENRKTKAEGREIKQKNKRE